jgi:hypothetical protein
MRSTRPWPGKLLSFGAALSLAASALSFWIWIGQYVSVDFNELGRHFDAAAQVVTTDASFVWGLAALGFLGLAVALLALRLRLKRSSRAGSSGSRARSGCQ